MFISHVEILGVETCSQILETGEDDIVQTGTFLYVFIVFLRLGVLIFLGFLIFLFIAN